MPESAQFNGRYHTVLFDFDHTLFDSDTSERLAFAHAMGQAGIADSDRYFADYQTINQAMFRAVEQGEMTVAEVGFRRWHRFVEHVGLEADGHLLTTEFGHGMANNGALYDGAIELLETVSDQATLGLVTNALSDIQRGRIERVGVGHYFQAIAISAEVDVAKPETGIFEAAYSQLGLAASGELGPQNKRQTVMIGDSLSSDIRGGYNFGVDTIWFNPKGHPFDPPSSDWPAPTYTAATFDDIARIIGGG